NEQHGGYLNMACGVGMSEDELDELFSRLATEYARFTRKNGFFMPEEISRRNDLDDYESDE
ncbi:hypothetical protein GCK32_009714, partial [Trichostrongylus colubriformis]